MLHLEPGCIWCWNLGTSGEKNLKNRISSEVWHWRKMEKICRTDRLKNKVLPRDNEKRNILHRVKWRKPRCIVHMSPKRCPLKHVIERKLETARRRERRRTQLLDNFKEMKRHWNSKKIWTVSQADQEINGFTKFVWLFQYTDYFTAWN